MFSKINKCFLLSATCVILLCKPSFSQEETKTSQLDIALQSILSEAESTAVAAAIKLTQFPVEIYESGCFGANVNCSQFSVNGWLLDLVPEVDITAGENGAFQNINGKITGNFITGEVITAAEAGLPVSNPDIVVLNTSGPLHIFPISIGAETTRFFNSTAVIGETGYVPFNTNFGKSIFGNELQLGLNPYLGFFLQGGYKFEGSNAALKGNSTDQSGEATNEWIARAKVDFRYDQPLAPIPLLGLTASPKVMTQATGWYDIRNNNFHHSVSVGIQFKLSDEQNTNFELKFEDGSGEPNFNTGSQFTSALSWTF